MIIRCLDEEGATKYDFYLSNAPGETPIKEFARVATAAHRVEEAIKRSKSQAGLSHYEVRNWRGWHHHQVLSLIATWFLVRESHRGKKIRTGNHRAANPRWHRHVATSRLRLRHSDEDRPQQNTSIVPKRTSSLLPLQSKYSPKGWRISVALRAKAGYWPVLRGPAWNAWGQAGDDVMD